MVGEEAEKEGSVGKIQQVETVSTLPEQEWRVSEKAEAGVSEEDRRQRGWGELMSRRERSPQACASNRLHADICWPLRARQF